VNSIPGIFAALAAGLLSFLSPCVLPLIPSYLSILSGASVKELRGQEDGGTTSRSIKSSPWRSSLLRSTLIRSLAFVAGFTVLFVVLGVLLSSSAAMLGGASRTVSIIAGTVVIVLGLNVMLDFAAFLRFEARVHKTKRPQSAVGAFLFGMAFAAGWSPCVGPLLASILALAGSGAPGRAALLLFFYSLGLGLPFIAFGLFFGRLEGLLGALKRHMKAVKIVSGGFLVIVGFAMILGTLQSLNGLMLRTSYSVANFAETNPGIAQWGATLLYGLIALAFGFIKLRRGASRPIFAPILGIALFAILAILEATGVIHSLAALASWFTFQGI